MRLKDIPNASAVVFVNDVPGVTAFYRNLSPMSVSTEDSEHSVLALPGFELVIHKLSNECPVERDPMGRARAREDSYIKICLPVVNIAVARTIAKSLGGYVKDRQFEWEARGFRACDGCDPEGNIFQIRELIAEQSDLPKSLACGEHES